MSSTLHSVPHEKKKRAVNRIYLRIQAHASVTCIFGVGEERQ
jgi:hypothetical protein